MKTHMQNNDIQYYSPKAGPAHRAAASVPLTSPLAAPRNASRWLLIAAILLSGLGRASEVRAGSTINAATAGAAGTAVTIANSAATKLLNANTVRYAWTVYCSGAAGAIAALMMPGDSANDPASPAPTQTVGFPIPANTLVNSTDFPMRGLDAIHQRIDAVAQGGSAISCYTWEEQ